MSYNIFLENGNILGHVNAYDYEISFCSVTYFDSDGKVVSVIYGNPVYDENDFLGVKISEFK